MIKRIHLGPATIFFLSGLIVFIFLNTAGAAASTVSDTYPLIFDRFLKSAELVDMTGDSILKTGTGIAIAGKPLEKSLDRYDPKLRKQLKENLIFLLEQEIITKILAHEVQKNGFSKEDTKLEDQISAYLSSAVKEAEVLDSEAKAFYDGNKEMVGGVPFEQVKDNIKSFLLKKKRQDAVETHIAGLAEHHKIQINREWMDTQYAIMKKNPVDNARSSGKVTMVEFGATGCIPCDMMQPILDSLKKKFPDVLNIEFVHVREEQILAGRFGIQSIPVQVFFDKTGREVFRHIGFFAEKEVLKQLDKMGVTQ
ncbi:MAG: thioredoxin family protein [Proteobacteria bacterium]|nr:thioredoxin family protein [Pseudomonadota bacterium]